MAENKSQGGKTAVKAFRDSTPYLRERAAYERLREACVSEVLGCNIPQFIRADDQWCVIEMSIVMRPFVLDFAGAYLDAPPFFSDQAWEEWEAGKREQFEGRWPRIRAILAALEEWDIYMVDVTPTNIALLD